MVLLSFAKMAEGGLLAPGICRSKMGFLRDWDLDLHPTSYLSFGNFASASAFPLGGLA